MYITRHERKTNYKNNKLYKEVIKLLKRRNINYSIAYSVLELKEPKTNKNNHLFHVIIGYIKFNTRLFDRFIDYLDLSYTEAKRLAFTAVLEPVNKDMIEEYYNRLWGWYPEKYNNIKLEKDFLKFKAKAKGIAEVKCIKPNKKIYSEVGMSAGVLQ